MKNRLKVYRAMHDLTQEALAEKLGVTRQTIVSLENGKYDPSIHLAFKAARFFGVRIEDLFIVDEQKSTVRPLEAGPPTQKPSDPWSGNDSG